MLVWPMDEHKMAMIMALGLFKYVCMPFGLLKARQTFQCLMVEVLASLYNCFVYIIDVLIGSQDA